MTRRGDSAADRELVARAIEAARVPPARHASFERDYWASVRMASVSVAAFDAPALKMTVEEARGQLAALEKALSAVEAGLAGAHSVMGYAMEHGVGQLVRDGDAQAEEHLSRFFDADRSPFAAEVAAWRSSAAYLREQLQPVNHRRRAMDAKWFSADQALQLIELHHLRAAAAPLAEVIFEAVTGRQGGDLAYRCDEARRERKLNRARSPL